MHNNGHFCPFRIDQWCPAPVCRVSTKKKEKQIIGESFKFATENCTLEHIFVWQLASCWSCLMKINVVLCTNVLANKYRMICQFLCRGIFFFACCDSLSNRLLLRLVINCINVTLMVRSERIRLPRSLFGLRDGGSDRQRACVITHNDLLEQHKRHNTTSTSALLDSSIAARRLRTKRRGER